MPMIMNQNLNIHYLEWGQSDKPPMILIFGFGMSAMDWFDLGYVRLLEPCFRIIAIEPRGHGTSATPAQAGKYTLTAMASDIDAVITALQLDNVIVWGYSLGAKIALAYAGQATTKIAALILGGFELHSKVDLPNDLVANTLGKTGQDWLGLWQSMFNIPPSVADRIRKSNLTALRVLREAEASWPDLSGIPPKLAMPCLLYAGENCFFRTQTFEITSSFQQGEYLERKDKNHFELMLDAHWICTSVINHFGK